MWPFTHTGVTPDPQVTRAEFLELKTAVQALERGLDDLHNAYRRLRGGIRHDIPVEKPAAAAEASPPAKTKDQLRAQARELLKKNNAGVS